MREPRTPQQPGATAYANRAAIQNNLQPDSLKSGSHTAPRVLADAHIFRQPPTSSAQLTWLHPLLKMRSNPSQIYAALALRQKDMHVNSPTVWATRKGKICTYGIWIFAAITTYDVRESYDFAIDTS